MPPGTHKVLSKTSRPRYTIGQILKLIESFSWMGEELVNAIAPVNASLHQKVMWVEDFTQSHIRYREDGTSSDGARRIGDEELSSFRSIWHNRFNPNAPCDCDDFTYFCGTLLYLMGVNFAAKMAQYDEGRGFQHVYIVVPKDQSRDYASEEAFEYYTIDPVIQGIGNEHKPIIKSYKTTTMGRLTVLDGIGYSPIKEPFIGAELQEILIKNKTINEELKKKICLIIANYSFDTLKALGESMSAINEENYSCWANEASEEMFLYLFRTQKMAILSKRDDKGNLAIDSGQLFEDLELGKLRSLIDTSDEELWPIAAPLFTKLLKSTKLPTTLQSEALTYEMASLPRKFQEKLKDQIESLEGESLSGMKDWWKKHKSWAKPTLNLLLLLLLGAKPPRDLRDVKSKNAGIANAGMSKASGANPSKRNEYDIDPNKPVRRHLSGIEDLEQEFIKNTQYGGQSRGLSGKGAAIKAFAKKIVEYIPKDFWKKLGGQIKGWFAGLTSGGRNPLNGDLSTKEFIERFGSHHWIYQLLKQNKIHNVVDTLGKLRQAIDNYKVNWVGNISKNSSNKWWNNREHAMRDVLGLLEKFYEELEETVFTEAKKSVSSLEDAKEYLSALGTDSKIIDSFISKLLQPYTKQVVLNPSDWYIIYQDYLNRKSTKYSAQSMLNSLIVNGLVNIANRRDALKANNSDYSQRAYYLAENMLKNLNAIKVLPAQVGPSNSKPSQPVNSDPVKREELKKKGSNTLKNVAVGATVIAAGVAAYKLGVFDGDSDVETIELD